MRRWTEGQGKNRTRGRGGDEERGKKKRWAEMEDVIGGGLTIVSINKNRD